MSYGPAPWQQTQWDWRAAANFICGGAGSGLIMFAAVSGVRGNALAALLLGGLALVGAGLLCVWLEIGRPLRALHVFFNPRTSWMSREAFVAALLMPAVLAAVAGLPGAHWLAALLALAFVYCQGRILRAAKGIPAWREPLVVPLVVLTGLAEGGGLWLLLMADQAEQQPLLLLGLVSVLLLARAAVWLIYRQRLATQAAPRALAALARADLWLRLGGTVVPLVLIALVAGGLTGAAPPLLFLLLAGVLACATGAWLKYTLVARAGFNQGFGLAHLPVRGVRR